MSARGAATLMASASRSASAASRASVAAVSCSVERRALGVQLRDRRLGVLGALHHLELDVLELGLPTDQRGELVLDRLEVLGGAGAGVEAGLVASRAVADQLHVGLGLGDLALDVAQLGPGPHQQRVEALGLGLEVGQPGVLGQVLAGVLDLVETGVYRLQVEQSPLTGRVGFQDVPPGPAGGSAPTTKSHGSVRSVEMWVSTLEVPSPVAAIAARTRSAAPASHSDSVAQWPASTM